MSLKSLKNQTLRNKSTINSVNLTGGASTGPVITSIVVTDSNYNNLDDTALLPAGGYAKLIGSGFASGCSAYFNGTSVTTTFVSATEVRVVIPATSVGTYNVMLFNPSTAGAIYLNLGISSAPTFTTTAGSLGTSYETTAVSTSIAATGDTPITYALYSGSLPTGVTLASNGTLSGTSPVEASSTTYSFIVQATDAQLQDTTRSFSLTISTDVVTWSTPAADFAYTLIGNEAMANVSLLATSAAGYGVTYAANTLPTGVSLSGNTVFGTPTTEQTIYTALTATANTTGRTATRYVSWSVVLGDAFWKYNTLLIPGASTTFVDDASTNNFAVTINGDTRPNNFSPYTAGYYSNFFDGSGDWLTFPNNAGYEFGSGAFTVELWAYITGSSGTVANYSNGQSSNSNFAWELYQVSTTVMQFSVFEGATQYISSSSAFKTNSWNHIACVRSGNTLTTYVNGVAGGTTANITGVSISVPASSTLKLCSYGNGSSYLTGYISNFRVVKGTAVYTAAFTPSTTPLTAISNTSLLTCQSNRFIDNSTNNFTITVTGNTLISSFDPFVPNTSYSTYGSGYFDGTGDYLSIPSNAALQLPTGDFTIEAWIYLTGALGSYYFIFTQTGSTNATSNWDFTVNGNASGQLRFEAFSGGTQIINLIGTSSVPVNAWTHVAVTRSGSTYTIWMNGISQGTASSASTVNTNALTTYIGQNFNNTYYFPGYITDARLVKGTAVYTTTFTPPSAPLTAIANTSLLTLQNNQPVNNNIFLDNSTNNSLITRSGNTTQGTFSPYGDNWSNYFTGASTSYIQTPAGSTTAILGTAGGGITPTATFTIECWIYQIQRQTALTTPVLIGDQGVNGSLYWTFGPDSSGKLAFYHYTGSQVLATGNDTIPLNTWTHIAMSINSGAIKLFVNGTLQTITGATTTGTQSGTFGYLLTGGFYNFTSTHAYIGNLSNLRIVKSALYSTTFTPSTTPLTPITNTGLLMCQSSRFIDNSPNAFALTTGSTLSVQRFSPFNPLSVTPTSYSGYFDGSGDYLSVPTTSGNLNQTGDFTYEMWIYWKSMPTTGYQNIAGQGEAGQSSYGLLAGNAASNTWSAPYVFKLNVANSGDVLNGNTALVAGQWYHLAHTRTSGVNRLFVDGVVQTNTYTDNTSRTFAGNPYLIGNNSNGYISNFRFIQGTSLYTTTFTPPTSPLTAVSGTQLLTLQSPTFIDNSTNNLTITAVGNSQPTIQNSFGFTSALTNGYTPSTIGGSGYFDGTGDYLTVPYSSSFSIPSNTAFTFECWVYTTINNIFTVANRNWNYGGTGPTWAFYLNNGTTPGWGIAGTGYSTYNMLNSSSVSGKLGAWNHYVWTRDSSNVCSMYVNGINGGVSRTDGQAMTSGSGNVFIGVSSNLASPYANGNISNMRFVLGTAVYTSNFVPPASPLQAITNTSLLTNMTSAGIYDAAMMTNMETLGDAKLSTAVSKFGGSSMSFDGTGDYLTAPFNPTFNLGTGNFTIEFWVNTSSTVAYATALRLGDTWTTGSWALYLNDSGGSGYPSWWNQTGSYTLSTSGALINDGSWHHIALVRNGATMTMYIDGTSRGTLSIGTNTVGDTTTKLWIGRDSSNVREWVGYMDDLRITKGYARYTSNFTPPTSAFQIK
jgi:hypothetical protein